MINNILSTTKVRKGGENRKMLFCRGGEIIESVSFGVDVESKLLKLTEDVYLGDFEGGYNNQPNFFSYEANKTPYIKSYEVNKKQERYYDYYNHAVLDEYGEIDSSAELQRYDGVNGYYSDEDDLIFLEGGLHGYNLILNPDYDLYICDNCNIKYLDFQKITATKIEHSNKKIDVYARVYDFCSNCRKVKAKKNQKEAGKKAIETMYKNGRIPSSRQQRYICNLLNGELNKRVSSYFVDMVFNDNIVLEYDGSGHWLGSRYSDKTIEQIDQEDVKRDNTLIGKGYKVIRFISREDLLPSDNKIKDIVDSLVSQLNAGKDKVIYEIKKEDFKDEELRKIEKRDLENE